MKATNIAIALLLLTASCSSPQKENTEQPAASRPAPVEVETEKTEAEKIDAVTSATNVSNEAVFNGTFVLSPRHHASVTLSMDGIVKNTTLLPGKYVKKGELLATLENPEFVDLQQNYLDASAQCEYLEAEYKRQEVLSREEAASQKKFQQSKADYLSMKSRKDATAAQLSMLGVSPETLQARGIASLLEVRAPISGYISNLQMNMGKHIPAGEPLCDIIDKNNTLIKLTAYEKDISRIKSGHKILFRVSGMGNESFDGEIISVGQSVDNVNRSLEVYARVMENNELFRPGMYINARIVQK
ncbi:MAG: efflux RND transporter periplasmic adaptor subunit [Bacteroides sp.]|nr:efflux RND transporter periplasmic adaptor subunit [Bacteroides sp.]